MGRRIEPPRTIKRVIDARLRRLERQIGDDLMRARVDAGASIAQVASSAGIDRAHVGRIERGVAHPSLEVLVACAAAIGADVSIPVYTGTGPRLTDRHPARMVECVLRELHPTWRARLEVPVPWPTRGLVDAVFARGEEPMRVIAEFQSMLPRVEQQLRWMAEKAEAIARSDGGAVSRLLVLRSTESTRQTARQFESTLRIAYPARSRDAWTRFDRGCPGLATRSSGSGSTVRP